jgi:BirA family biotin operon repressor/biotin-[acetyl-CoA-carboxylase] ligase
VVGWYFLEQGLFAPWDSFLAVSQWAGRGHKGRRWRSPEGNLFVSFVGPPFQRDLGIFPSVLFGFIVVQSLRFLGVRTSLKWPNDLIFNDAKLGGILIQERPEQFLVGIGINLRTLPQEAQEIHDPALEPGCLDPSPYPEWGPLRWWAALVHQMIVWYEHILLWGEEALCSRIEDCLAFKERKVWVLSDYDVPYLARVKGLDSNGRLRVCRGGRLKTLQQERIFPKD